MARPEGIEPPTPGSEVPCSVLLSYGRSPSDGCKFSADADRRSFKHSLQPCDDPDETDAVLKGRVGGKFRIVRD